MGENPKKSFSQLKRPIYWDFKILSHFILSFSTSYPLKSMWKKLKIVERKNLKPHFQ